MFNPIPKLTLLNPSVRHIHLARNPPFHTHWSISERIMPSSNSAMRPELSAKHAEALRSLIQSHVSTRPKSLGGNDSGEQALQDANSKQQKLETTAKAAVEEFNKQALAALMAARQLPSVTPDSAEGSILTHDQIDEIFVFLRQRVLAYTGSWLILSYDSGVIRVDSDKALGEDLQWEIDAFTCLYSRLAGVLEPFVEFRTGMRSG